jgi:hypothetical protein
LDFLRRFLRNSREPDRSSWARISTVIATGLEVGRQDWCDLCVGFLEDANRRGIFSVPIRRRQFIGEGELAVKGFQLWAASNTLGKHQYIPRESGKEFADLLYSQVCGTRLPDVIGYLNRYHEVAGESQQLTRFCLDVAENLTDESSAFIVSMGLVSMIRYLLVGTATCVATAFGDTATADRMQASLEQQLRDETR